MRSPRRTLHGHALRDVIGHCLYGVIKTRWRWNSQVVSLWMEAPEPGKLPNFLEHRIQPLATALLGSQRLPADERHSRCSLQSD